MGDDHHCHAFLRELHHHIQHLVDHLRVERGRRLVEEHADRIHRQRPRNRDALLLPAGELSRKFVFLRNQADAVEQLQAALDRLFAAAVQHLDLSQRQVVDDLQVREQLEVLEHHPDARPQLGEIGLGVAHRNPVDGDRALLEWLQGVDALDERRLARAGRPANDDHFALLDLGRAIGQYLKVTVPLGNLVHRNHRCSP